MDFYVTAIIKCDIARREMMAMRVITSGLLISTLAMLLITPGTYAADDLDRLTKPTLTIIEEPSGTEVVAESTIVEPEKSAALEITSEVISEGVKSPQPEAEAVMPATAAMPVVVEEYVECPEEKTPAKKLIQKPAEKITTLSEINQAARIAYVMAGNRVRQGEYKDALRYYMDALSTEPNFIQAMADIALIYKHLGDFDSAQDVIDRAIRLAPEDSNLYHIKGEVHQARGLELKEHRKEYESGVEIHTAVITYGRSIELAEKGGSMASRAGTYFRLGEVCYFAHGDPDGARLYWRQVIDLHTPIPDLSEPVADYRRNTSMSVELITWQQWAKTYMRQLDSVIYGPRPRPAQAGNLYGNASEGEEISAPAPAANSKPKSRRFWNWRPRR